MKEQHWMAEWHPIKNGALTLADISAGSHKIVWWIGKCGHEWLATMANRTKGSGCPYCAGRKVCHDNCLAISHPDIAKEWHPTKNIPLTPSDVTTGSSKKVWWQCKFGHEWEATIVNRSRGSGCPYDVGKKVSIENSLAARNSSLAKEWHPVKNGSLTSRKVTLMSNKKVWWKCSKEHEWQATIANRSQGRRCPFCRMYIIKKTIIKG